MCEEGGLTAREELLGSLMGSISSGRQRGPPHELHTSTWCSHSRFLVPMIRPCLDRQNDELCGVLVLSTKDHARPWNVDTEGAVTTREDMSFGALQKRAPRYH